MSRLVSHSFVCSLLHLFVRSSVRYFFFSFVLYFFSSFARYFFSSFVPLSVPLLHVSFVCSFFARFVDS